MEQAYENIVNNIKKYISANEFLAKPFYFESLNKNLLCVYLFGGTHSTLYIYDDKHNMNAVGEILYNVNGDKAFISQIECMEEMQKCGIGKFLFNMALAHADALKATSVSGCIKPCNAIKGISDNSSNNNDKEVEALKEIYKRLGCTITEENLFGNANYKTYKFSQQWNPGEKLNDSKLISLSQKQFLFNMVNMQKTLKR